MALPVPGYGFRLAAIALAFGVLGIPGLNHAQQDKCTALAVRGALANETVPDLVGCDIAFVRQVWTMFQKDAVNVTTEHDPEVPLDRVMAQAPKAGDPTAYLEAGLSVTVSLGPREQELPPAPPPPVYQVTVTAPSSVEEDSELIFTVTRNPRNQPLLVAYSVVSGNNAQPEIDFAPRAGTYLFKPGEREFQVSVIIPDRAGENGPRQVLLTVGPGGDVAFDPVRGVATIVDRVIPPESPEPAATFSPDGDGATGNDPWWTDPLKLGAILFAVLVTGFSWLLLRPKPVLEPVDEFDQPDAPEPEAEFTAPDLTSDCMIEPGSAALEGDSLPLDAPALGLSVQMGWDPPDSPETLPILEVERSNV